MTDVKLTVTAPKEVVDVLVALDGLVSKVVAKEPLTQIVAEELPVLLTTYASLIALPVVVKNEPEQTIDAAELYVRRIVSKLLGHTVAPVVVS